VAISVSVTERKGYKSLYLEIYEGSRRIKRVSAKTPDRAVAEQKRDELLRVLSSQAAGYTIGTCWDLHVAFRLAKKNRYKFSEGTETNYASARNRLDWTPDDDPGGPSLLERDIAKVDEYLLQNFHDDLAKRLSGNTIKSTFNCLKAVWDWTAKTKKGVSAYPGHPTIEVEPTDKVGFTQEEMTSILLFLRDYLKGRWFTYFMLLGLTGARSSEILSLRGQDVDRQNNTVTILKTVNKKKLSKKFAVDPRVVTLVPPRQAADLLFPKIRPAYRDGKPTASRVTLKVLRKAMWAVGISPDRMKVLDQHSLRRSWAVFADAVGVSLGVAMDQLDHQSPKVHAGYLKNTVKPGQHAGVRKVTDLFAVVFSQEEKQGGKQGGTLPPIQAAMPLKTSEILPLSQGPASC
jgi:integrase